MLFNAFILAIRAISRNLMRSFLTTLGIVIGIASVIIMVSLGNSVTASITGSIEKLGSNMLIVVPGQRRHGPSAGSTAPLFKAEDLRAIEEQISDIKAVTPTVTRSTIAVYGSENHKTNVTGTDNAFFTVREWQVERGRIFSSVELRSGKPVCLIGTTIVDELFASQEPLHATLRLGKLQCEIIGVMQKKGASTFGQDQDDAVIIPLRTFQRRLSGNTDISSFLVALAETAQNGDVITAIQTLLRERRHISKGEEDDFTVMDLKEIIQTVSETTGILTLLLGAVAAISLLVGGIGIMNIMLVSVTERTREIGIRLAIGALEREVLIQFLVEAIVLSTLGGSIGVLLGVLGSLGVTQAFDLPFVFNAQIIIIAFSFSTAVGVVFGYFPARKAATMDPIDALRRE